MNELEKKLCEVYNRKSGVYTGNGTTALYLIFKALGMQQKKVIFPAISCTNPVNSAIYAGYHVDFCDVNVDNYTINIEYLEQMLKTGAYGIVVPTHIYGHVCDISKVVDLCNKYNVTVIEDSAQTTQLYGGVASITSFGHTKIFETTCEGGMAFTNDYNLYEKINCLKKELPDKPDNIQYLTDEYRKKYYEIKYSDISYEQKLSRIKKLQLNSQNILIYHCEKNNEILNKMSRSDEIKKQRKKKKNLYIDRLDKKFIRIPKYSQKYDETLWRFSFLYKKDREKLLKDVRKNGIDISSWYPSLSMIYKNEHLHNADIVSGQIVNLWLDETHSFEDIVNEINIINRCMEA